MRDVNHLGTENITKLLIKLSIPAMFSMLVISIYNIVDTLFISRFLGKEALAGINLILPIQLFTFSIALAIAIGTSARISVNFGKRNFDKAEKNLGNGFALAILVGLILTIIILIFQDSLISSLGVNSDSFLFARNYISIILFGTTLTMLNLMFNSSLRSLGLVKITLILAIISSILNIILDYIFIKTFFMGAFGVGLATVLSQLLTTICLLSIFLFRKMQLNLKLKNIKLSLKENIKIVKIGIPSFIKQISFFIMILITNHLLVKYAGILEIGAFGITQKIIMLMFFPAIGFVQGMIPITGYNYGAKNKKRLKETYHLTIKITTSIIFAISTLIIVFADKLSALFTSNLDLISVTTTNIRISLIGVIFAGYVITSGSYLQSIKKPIPASLISSLRLLIILIPIMIILSNLFGWIGILISIPLTDFISVPITYLIMRKYT